MSNMHQGAAFDRHKLVVQFHQAPAEVEDTDMANSSCISSP